MKKKILSLATASIVFLSSTSAVFADYNFSLPLYKKSMYHQDVKVIQEIMIKEGFLNVKSPTNYYGPLTEGAVLSFQKKYGLYTDGIAGKNTLAKINSLDISDGGSTYSFSFSKSIYKLGDRHSDVSKIQSALKTDGTFTYPTITTYYGPVTRQAVIDFQRKYGLYADGIAGKNTLAKINSLGTIENSVATSSVSLSKSIYKLGERHDDIAKIQSALKKDGVFTYPTITTYFGPITKQAVITFQRKYGLYADGIVGKNTIAKMTSLGLFDGSTFSANRSSTSRESVGEYLDWWSEAKDLVPWYATFEVVDLYTGKSFMAKRTGGSNHADVEALTAADTNKIKEIWGGNFSWARRPVLVKTNGRTIAASATGMPHAGNDNAPSREYTTWRSDGYGAGTNYDSVKDNGMHGHIDIHFRNSTRHSDGQMDEKHQEAVKEAAGLK